MKKIAIIITVFGLFTGFIVSAAKEEVKAEVGKEAPDFELQTIKGEEVSLKDYTDKIVVLEWTNHGCPFVKKHYKTGNMQELQEKFTKKGVVWLTVCSSAPGKQGYMKNEAWQEKVKETDTKSTAVLPDPEGKVGRMYGATATPNMFVIDKSGILVYAGAIDDKRSVDPKSVKEAKNYVAEVVEALLDGEEVEPDSTKPYGCSVKY